METEGGVFDYRAAKDAIASTTSHPTMTTAATAAAVTFALSF
jgi:hypothetical protein